MAGGHLGFKIEQIDDPNFVLEKLVTEVVAGVVPYTAPNGRPIPVIAAGGIYTGADIHRMLFGGPGGWPVEPGWWKRTPEAYTDQKERACPHCGCAIPLKRRPSTEEIDDVSPGNLEALLAIHSPKALSGRVEIYGGGLAKDWNPGPNWYMSEMTEEKKYRERIAARLDGGDTCAPGV